MCASRNTLALVMNGYQCQGIKTRKEQAANLINDFNLDENLEIRDGGAARSLNVNSRNFFIMLEHDPALDESRKRHARLRSSIDAMGWSLRRLRRIRLRNDLERHSLNKSDPFAIEHFKDTCVARPTELAKNKHRETHHSHLSPPAQKLYRFAALEYIEEQAQRFSSRAFKPGIFLDGFARFVARQV
jgi:hypothetical protein